MDLELAYVGHLCLSWEVLKWQHHKAEQLSDHDSDGFHLHNQVSGEFQKFQVILQRLTEDEPFQNAPRVPHYIKTPSAHPGHFSNFLSSFDFCSVRIMRGRILIQLIGLLKRRNKDF